MANFAVGDHVKIVAILDNYTQDDKGRKILGQTGTIENVYSGGMILVRMDLTNSEHDHNLYDFVAAQLKLVATDAQVA